MKAIVSKRLLVWLASLAMLAVLSGCVSVDDESEKGGSALPWNAPANWENKTLGVPM